MKLLILIGILLTTFIITACGTTNYRFQPQQNSSEWQGKSIQALQTSWGSADQILHTRSGTSYYMYSATSSASFFNSTTTNFSAYSGTNNGLDLPRQQYSNNLSLMCTTIFETDKTGTIISIWHKGSNCGGQWVPKSTTTKTS